MTDEDADPSDLDDAALIRRLQGDLYDGLREEVEDGVQLLLERGLSLSRILSDPLSSAMTQVGADFRDGILPLPEVLLVAQAMQAGMAVLKPLMDHGPARARARMVIGTVRGDIHDIGKTLVAMMMEAAGIAVTDLGVNVPPESFVAAMIAQEADILGMSALLTSTMPGMKQVIGGLEEQGLRHRCLVLVGGPPVGPAFARAIGADACCRDAAQAVEAVERWIAARPLRLSA